MIARHIISIAILFSCFSTCLYSEDKFTPRFNIDHSAYISEALEYLLKERPQLKADDLEFLILQYQYQEMPDTIPAYGPEYGPEGVKIVPAAPFQETLSVTFILIDSKETIPKNSRKEIVHNLLIVHFPTPRMPQWYINEGRTVAQESKTKTQK